MFEYGPYPQRRNLGKKDRARNPERYRNDQRPYRNIERCHNHRKYPVLRFPYNRDRVPPHPETEIYDPDLHDNRETFFEQKDRYQQNYRDSSRCRDEQKDFNDSLAGFRSHIVSIPVGFSDELQQAKSVNFIPGTIELFSEITGFCGRYIRVIRDIRELLVLILSRISE
jgi:hypothetical protein